MMRNILQRPNPWCIVAPTRRQWSAFQRDDAPSPRRSRGRTRNYPYDGAAMTMFPAEGPDPPWCPLLGVVTDRRTHFTYPHPGHRCFAKGQPARIGAEQQSAYCLSAAFPTCARFDPSALDPAASEPRSVPTPSIEPTPAVHPVASAAQPTVVMYVVGTRDSLARIAKKYSLTVGDLATANGLTEDAVLADGDRVVIPLELTASPRARTGSPRATPRPVDGATPRGRSSGSPSDA
jgi:LysM repeat protein